MAAAQEARRLAGRASAAASDARASALDVRSSRTDQSDGMGMNIAGGYQQVQKDAAAFDISADDLVRAKRGDAGFFGGRASAAASDARASALDVRSIRKDWPDGMGMNIAGGYEKVQKDAAALDISVDELVRARRSDAASSGGHQPAAAAAALLSRGAANASKGVATLKHPDAV